MFVNSSLTRGGQTMAHQWRMFLQIVRIFLWLGGSALVAYIGGLMLWYVSLYEAYQAAMWYVCYLLWSMFENYNTMVPAFDADWHFHQVALGRVLSSESFYQALYKVKAVFWLNLYDALMATGVLIVASMVFFIRRGSSMGRTKTVRGVGMVKKPQLVRLIRGYNGWRHKPYKIVGVPYPKDTEVTHTLICGTTGTGKTTVLMDLVAQIRERGDRAIIYDRTGAFTETFYDGTQDVILNPFDVRSPNWSVFNEGRELRDFDMMATALMPEQKGQVDPFWVLAARALFSSFCQALTATGETSNDVLVQRAMKADMKEMAKLLEHTTAQSIIDKKSPKTALSVRTVLTTNLRCLEHLVSDPGKEEFSVRDWIRDDGGQGFLLLPGRADMQESLRGLRSCWLEIAINTLLSLSESRSRKIWIVLDEVPSLNQIPSLQYGMAESRKFGGCFVLGLQSWAAMKSIYGQSDAEALSSLARTRVLMATPDKDTADWGSRSLGNVQVRRQQESISYGANTIRDGVNLSEREEINPIILPTQLMNLRDLEGYLRVSQGFPITQFKAKRVERKKVAEGLMERPARKAKPVAATSSAKAAARGGKAGVARGPYKPAPPEYEEWEQQAGVALPKAKKPAAQKGKSKPMRSNVVQLSLPEDDRTTKKPETTASSFVDSLLNDDDEKER